MLLPDQVVNLPQTRTLKGGLYVVTGDGPDVGTVVIQSRRDGRTHVVPTAAVEAIDGLELKGPSIPAIFEAIGAINAAGDAPRAVKLREALKALGA